MEEKKTKKMTKAEAFEYLKGKKVACDSRSEEVQRKLFEVGMRWLSGSTEVIKCSCIMFLIIDLSGIIVYCYSRECFVNHKCNELTADDILSIEIVEEEKEPLDKWDDFYRRATKI